jgi:hypothetical protein
VPADSLLLPFDSTQRLVGRYGQVDIDAEDYRNAAAQRVGLAMPDRVPLQDPKDYAGKYDIAARLSQLKGVAGMKAQLYGAAAFNLDSGATTAAATATSGADESVAGSSLADVAMMPSAGTTSSSSTAATAAAGSESAAER